MQRSHLSEELVAPASILLTGQVLLHSLHCEHDQHSPQLGEEDNSLVSPTSMSCCNTWVRVGTSKNSDT